MGFVYDYMISSSTLRAPIVANVINKPVLFGNCIGFILVKAVDDQCL